MGVGERGRGGRGGLIGETFVPGAARFTGQDAARIAKAPPFTVKQFHYMIRSEKLAAKILEKPWGRRGLDARFGVDGETQVGEIWFERPTGQPLDVLAKYLFTTERLSIPVHPDGAIARDRGFSYGKDECWIILSVADTSEIGIGTVRDASSGEVMAAARDGSIVDLVDWRRPRVGDFFYNPAGTIHALGAGLTVLEIQQAVDITYRLFDYGRERGLHLEEARDVVQARPHHHRLDGPIGEGSKLLVAGPHFGVAWCVGEPPLLPQGLCDVQLLPIDVAVGGIGPGECALIDEHAARRLRSEGIFVLAWSPAR
jgi:mannose-6-phosphate isomerase